MAKMIDPPQGWLYGFPKELPEDVTDIIQWLVTNGYPQALIDAFRNEKGELENFFYRVWEK